jgi:hypothetical protein
MQRAVLAMANLRWKVGIGVLRIVPVWAAAFVSIMAQTQGAPSAQNAPIIANGKLAQAELKQIMQTAERRMRLGILRMLGRAPGWWV